MTSSVLSTFQHCTIPTSLETLYFPSTIDPLVVHVAKRIINIVQSRCVGASASFIQSGDLIMLSITKLTRVDSSILLPRKWKLELAELDCVCSSVFDCHESVMRVVLAPSVNGRWQLCSKVLWADTIWQQNEPRLDPALLTDVHAENREIVKREIHDLVDYIARESIASAQLRGSNCRASVAPPLPVNVPKVSNDIVCVVVTTGLHIISSRSLCPDKWDRLLHVNVRSKLKSFYLVQTHELRTRVNKAAEASFRIYPVPNQPASRFTFGSLFSMNTGSAQQQSAMFAAAPQYMMTHEPTTAPRSVSLLSSIRSIAQTFTGLFKSNGAPTAIENGGISNNDQPLPQSQKHILEENTTSTSDSGEPTTKKKRV
jgi:hypothetical protein